MSVIQKSHADFESGLMNALLRDVHRYHEYPDRESQAEIAMIDRRVKAEGFSFLTKTLPALGKALDSALNGGVLQPLPAFRKVRGAVYPVFLHRLYKKVVDVEGKVLESPCVACIRDIRQVAYAFYKYELPYEQKLVQRTIRDFVEVDKNIAPLSSDPQVQGVLYYGNEVVKQALSGFQLDNLQPTNGPGAVANQLPPWRRYRPTRFYPSLDGVCSYMDMYYYNDHHIFDDFDHYFQLPWEDFGTAKLLTVPKDSRGPRIISEEQSEFMTYQQALKRPLYRWIENHRLTGRQVNFTDQSINGELALKASIDREHATLDLSAASDRLSLDLVEGLFEDTPILEYLQGTRSRYTEHPSFGMLELKKFAPMGSALCFPIQALSFYALLVGRMVALGEELATACKMVWVYGDDIVVPLEFVPDAIETLESVGLKINVDKSCYAGHFRESCGTDAYKGAVITPQKFKKVWQPLLPKKKGRGRRANSQNLIAWVDAANQLYWRGNWEASRYITDALSQNGFNYPCVTVNSPVLGYTARPLTVARAYEELKSKGSVVWNLEWQSDVSSAHVVSVQSKSKEMTGWEYLLRNEWNSNFCTSILDDVEYLPPCEFTLRRHVKIRRRLVTMSEVMAV